MNKVTGRQQLSAKCLRAEQLAMSELEFEWIRQFYIQGERHKQLHVWWAEPMQQLLEHWRLLAIRTKFALEALQAAATFQPTGKSWHNNYHSN